MPPLPPPPIWKMQPRDFISDAFPRAQSAIASVSGPIMQFIQNLQNSRGSNYAGGALTPDIIKLMPPNALKASDPAGADPMEMNKTAGHEAAHSIWAGLPLEHQATWFKIHRQDPFVAGFGYKNDPTHAFAEAYGSYVAEPTRLQRESPAAYNFFKRISQFEYVRPGLSMNTW